MNGREAREKNVQVGKIVIEERQKVKKSRNRRLERVLEKTPVGGGKGNKSAGVKRENTCPQILGKKKGKLVPGYQTKKKERKTEGGKKPRSREEKPSNEPESVK